MSPSPKTAHQLIAGKLHFKILAFLEKHPIGDVFIAPLDVYLTDINIYQPDVIFVSAQRRSIIREYGIEGAPDLVVEILSLGTARFDKGSKRKIYAQTGVKELWIIDPETKLLHVYELTKWSDAPTATYGANRTLTSLLLPGFKMKTAAIFKSSAS